MSETGSHLSWKLKTEQSLDAQMMGETMQSRENSKSKALKLRLSMVGWRQVGTGLPDLAEECELYSIWILSRVVPGADLGL